MASTSRISKQAVSALLASGCNSAPAEASSSYGRTFVQAMRRHRSMVQRDTSPHLARMSVASMTCAQCRTFATSARRGSAWPAGLDAGSRQGQGDPQRGREGAERAGSRADSLPPPERAVTLADIAAMKAKKEPIAVLTAYDYPSGLSQRAAGVDICLVGDSLANVALGHRTTHALTMDAMIHHVQAVVRGLRHPTLNAADVPPIPLVVADLPYGSGVEESIEAGVRAATRLIKEGGADGVKIEGGDEIVPLVEHLASFGIPVMAHVGLQPQRASSGSALNLASRSADDAIDTLETARILQDAGAFSIVLEAVPARVGAALSERLGIPTIGIGAGRGTDGQVLVADDILSECTSPLHVLSALRGIEAPAQKDDGSSTAPALPRAVLPLGPRFVRNFAGVVTGGSSLGAIRMRAIQEYVAAVKARTFPDNDVEAYKMKREEWTRLKEMLEQVDKA